MHPSSPLFLVILVLPVRSKLRLQFQQKGATNFLSLFGSIAFGRRKQQNRFWTPGEEEQISLDMINVTTSALGVMEPSIHNCLKKIRPSISVDNDPKHKVKAPLTPVAVQRHDISPTIAAQHRTITGRGKRVTGKQLSHFFAVHKSISGY